MRRACSFLDALEPPLRPALSRQVQASIGSIILLMSCSSPFFFRGILPFTVPLHPVFEVISVYPYTVQSRKHGVMLNVYGPDIFSPVQPC